MTRRRRSVHFVPGGNDRFLGKALVSAADTLVFDLEDSVPPDRKPLARAAVTEWLESVDSGGRELMVRVNALDTPWAVDDIHAIAPLGVSSIMVPKVSSRAEIDDLSALVDLDDPEGEITLFPVATETPTAVVNLPSLGEHPRVDGLCWGAEDLSAELGGQASRRPDGSLLPVYVTVQSWCLLAARHAGVLAVDSVYPDFRDLDGLRREATEAALMGWDGKLSIHPDQIDVINEAFTPSTEAVETAAELLAAYDEAAAQGRAAFTFRGEMVDEPHIARARRLLARATP